MQNKYKCIGRNHSIKFNILIQCAEEIVNLEFTNLLY